MMMTGMSFPLSLKRRSNSIPVISGIRTSVMTHPGSKGLLLARNDDAVSYVRTSICAARRRKANESLAASSSSMTCTTGLDGIADHLPADASESKVKHCPSSSIGFSPYLPAMRFDDGSANRQTDPHPLLFGGDEGLKELGRHVWRNSRPGIGHGDANHIAIGRRGRQEKLPP